jgi:chromosome segregation ATPase
MSDSVKVERRSAPPAARESLAAPVAGDPFELSPGLRLDGAHSLGPPISEPLPHAHGEKSRPVAAPVESETPGSADSYFAATVPRNDADLLLQASQIAEHLRTQFAELDRREQSLNAQLHELDQERRNVRLWVRQFEDEVVECEGRLRAREAEAAQKLVSCERLAEELAKQQQNLVAARHGLEGERAAMRAEVERELAGRFDALREARASLAGERERLSEEREELRTRRAQLDEEAAAARGMDRAALRHEQEDWIARRDVALAEIEREREINDEALTRAQEELAELRRQQREELEKQKHQQEERLAEERQEFERERDSQLLRLQQDRTVLEKRVRFQQEHLQKVRHDLECALDAFRREQQQARVERERRDNLLRLRSAQLQRFRSILAERELSVERAQALIARLQQVQGQELERDRDEFRRDREAWEQERQAQRAELRRQQDLLALHAENLETRRSRLDQLRAELEETHRTTLEMRAAIDEVWTQLAQAAGADAARTRIEENRAAIAEHYRHLREALTQQRSEMDAAQTLFQRQKDEFRGERQTLTDWVAARDEQLRQWDEQVRQAADALETREAAWRAARDRWMHEKIEAEEVIRNLLGQLSDLNEPGASDAA